MFPELFKIPGLGIPIATYGVLLAIGFIAALWLTAQLAARDGLPKDRYRRYHVEKARGGVGLTMIGGSAVVSPDSPPSFGNLLLYRDDVVPWLRRLAEDVHAEGAAVTGCDLRYIARETPDLRSLWFGQQIRRRIKIGKADAKNFRQIRSSQSPGISRCRAQPHVERLGKKIFKKSLGAIHAERITAPIHLLSIDWTTDDRRFPIRVAGTRFVAG